MNKREVVIQVAGFLLCAGLTAIVPGCSRPDGSDAKERAMQTGYAPVNGLQMYYEIHGTGAPIVLLHGAYSAIGTSFGNILPGLSKTRQVIAVELQGHGRTADIDRPITYEQMADDVAALLHSLKIEKADIFGYSMGGGVALQTVIRHPSLVRKLVVVSASYRSDGMHRELLELIPSLTPEAFEGSPFKKEYDSLAPDPKAWPVLVQKLKKLDETPFAWNAEAITGITAPTLLVFGDSDAIRLEHAVEMFRLLGGGVMGDLKGLPNSQLAVLPATTHVGMIDRADWILSMIVPFLNAPVPDQSASGPGR